MSESDDFEEFEEAVTGENDQKLDFMDLFGF